MKFKFCSDGDCPLWALAGLHALGSLPAPLFRRLVAQVMDEKPDDGIMEILKDTSLSSREECARAAAVIRWVVSAARAGGCGGAALARDLLVLGVPRAHAAALAERAIPDGEPGEFTVNKVSEVSIAPAPEGAAAALSLRLRTEDSSESVVMTRAQAHALLTDLKSVYARMEQLEE